MVRDLVGGHHLRFPLVAGEYDDLALISLGQPFQGRAQTLVIIQHEAVIED